MPKLFNQTFSPGDLRSYMTDIGQIARVQRAVLQEGRAEGVQIIRFTTGSGFEFTVVPGRAMDISSASYNGIPLSWRASPGEVAAAYFEPTDLGWMRGYGGGLLTTGGLSAMGSPSIDRGEALGIHGRVSYLPASNVCADSGWEGDTYRLWARGTVCESVALGPNLLLRREIRTELGASHFTIHDTVENASYRRVEHMILYHFNIGFPLLSQTARLLLKSAQVTPRDADSRVGLTTWDRFAPPEVERPHQLFYHQLIPDTHGLAHVMLVGMQETQPLAVYLSYTHDVLPWLVNWKCMQAGDYVTGIEPANAWVEGRAVERDAGRLRFLEPWECLSYNLEFGVLAGWPEIAAFARRHDLPDPEL